MHETLRQNKELWDLFTRKEEYFPIKLDEHDRFTYANSNQKNILEPKVSKFLVENGLKMGYPENKKFAVCLTHDVDDVYPPLLHTLLSSFYCMKNLNFDQLKNQLLWKHRGKEFSPYRNFNEIMKLEEKYNATSSFYFIATDKDIPRFRLRFRCNIEDLESDLGSIIDKGWEVGLHCGYYSYDSLEEIKKEKKRLETVLGKEIIGCRNHYLRFKVPETWELLAKAGFKYDATFGYNDMVGFRNGMCHPFKPFNLSSSQNINILEIPLIVMDGTLFGLSNSYERAWANIKNLIDIVKKNNGIITLLWHNNAFNCPFRNLWKKLYEKILDYSYENEAWMTNGGEILRWWENGC